MWTTKPVAVQFLWTLIYVKHKCGVCAKYRKSKDDFLGLQQPLLTLTDTYKKLQLQTQLVHKWFSKTSTLAKHGKIFLKEGCIWFSEILFFSPSSVLFLIQHHWVSHRKTDSHFWDYFKMFIFEKSWHIVTCLAVNIYIDCYSNKRSRIKDIFFSKRAEIY